MSSLTVTSVASAAIISGDLIIGLSDGSIINCGRVQGPQGLDGPAGPIGAPGRPGQDGNTILTSEGLPRADVGTNGDYIIDKVSWTIYGPKANGVWGIGTPLRGSGGKGSERKRDLAEGVPTTGDGSSGGGGRVYNTSNLSLTGLGRSKTERKVNAPGGNIIPEANDLKVQANLNRWIVNSLTALDDALPVSVGDVLPDNGEYEGDLFLKDGLLYIYTKGEWIAVGGESGPPVYVGEDEPPNTPQTGELWYCTDEKYLTLFIYTGTTWAPAAPPVSLDGIEAGIAGLTYAVDELKTITTGQGQDIADAKSTQYGIATALKHLDEGQTRQDNQIIELEEEIESLAPTFDRGEWTFVTEQPAAGEYAIGHLATSEYCLDIVGKCFIEAGDDEVAKSKCNRIATECETAEEAGEAYLSDSWGGVDTLKIHKLDAKGKEHGFGDWTVGKYVELFNHDDKGYGLFVIDEAAVIEADVATFKVHHVAHEGKPSGVARAKVFEMGAADPTDFVRKSGSTMTGALNISVKDGNAAFFRSGTKQGTSVFYVRNGNDTTLFRVKGDGGVQAGADQDNPFIAGQANDITTKKYVDDAINAALATPARLEWKVFINLDGTPQQGLAYLNGASIGDTTVIRLHRHAINASLPINGHSSGLTMYKYSPSPKLYHAVVISAWHPHSGGWQWKGTAEIDEIKLFADYIEIKLGSRKYSNMNFGNTTNYRFTVGGLF